MGLVDFLYLNELYDRQLSAPESLEISDNTSHDTIRHAFAPFSDVCSGASGVPPPGVPLF
jgi:hypothetical protein